MNNLKAILSAFLHSGEITGCSIVNDTGKFWGLITMKWVYTNHEIVKTPTQPLLNSTST